VPRANLNGWVAYANRELLLAGREANLALKAKELLGAFAEDQAGDVVEVARVVRANGSREHELRRTEDIT